MILFSPAAGAWNVAAEPGAAAAVAVEIAEGLPPVQVSARVATASQKHPARQRGHSFARRVLTWSLHPLAGQRVTFVERGANVAHTLASTDRAGGTLRFTPAQVPGRARQIVALVDRERPASRPVGGGPLPRAPATAAATRPRPAPAWLTLDLVRPGGRRPLLADAAQRHRGDLGGDHAPALAARTPVHAAPHPGGVDQRTQRHRDHRPAARRQRPSPAALAHSTTVTQFRRLARPDTS